jgi:hypothetical protein
VFAVFDVDVLTSPPKYDGSLAPAAIVFADLACKYELFLCFVCVCTYGLLQRLAASTEVAVCRSVPRVLRQFSGECVEGAEDEGAVASMFLQC